MYLALYDAAEMKGLKRNKDSSVDSSLYVISLQGVIGDLMMSMMCMECDALTPLHKPPINV